MPNFTQDWFSHNIAGLKPVLARIPARKEFLEIGCFEGLSTCWFLTHHIDDDGRITCIDTFTGGSEHIVTKFDGVEERFRANVDEIKRPGQTVEIFVENSCRALSRLLAEGRQYDFIYVDGSHDANDVMLDACLCYHLLKVGGMMVFDDYLYGPDKPVLQTPKLAIDMFTTFYRDQVNIVLLNYQCGVQKVA